jgi:hypothetical protein
MSKRGSKSKRGTCCGQAVADWHDENGSDASDGPDGLLPSQSECGVNNAHAADVLPALDLPHFQNLVAQKDLLSVPRA